MKLDKHIDAATAIYKETYNKLDKWQRANILADIEALPAAEYAVLHCLYVQGLSLQEAADQAVRSYAWAALTHRKALDSLQKVLDEKKAK